MKRIVIWATVFTSMMALVGCSDSKIYVPENADLPSGISDYETADIEDYVIDVDASLAIDLIASGEHLVLYIGNSSCSACVAFKPSLIEYIDQSRATIYHFDNLAHADQYEQLPQTYPDFFTAEYAVTPSLYFFKDGEMTARRYGSTRMMDYATFRPIMEGYMRVSDVQLSRNVLGLQAAMNSDSILYFYDRSKTLEKEAFVNVIYPKTMQNSVVLWVCDVSFLNLSGEDLTTFLESFLLTESSGWLIKYDHGTIGDSYQLTTSTDPALDSWLSQYF